MANFTTSTVADGAGRDLTVDVFEPRAGSSRGVAAILLHGGGWVGGHRSIVHNVAEALAKAGIVAIAAEYRLLAESPWPAQVEDVRRVVRWTKTQVAKWSVKPENVALVGFSAGAHLAMMSAGTQPGSGFESAVGAHSRGSEVGAVVAFFGPVAFPPEAAGHPPISTMLAGDDVRTLSPMTYINPNYPPTFVLAGTADYMISLDATTAFYHALLAAGVKADLHYYHSQNHEFQIQPLLTDTVIGEVAFFLTRTLIDAERIEAEAKELNMFVKAGSREAIMQQIAAMAAQQKK